MARKTAFRGFSRRIIFCSLAAFLLVLWIICARTKSSKQTDRIVFSHGSTREQVGALPFSEILLIIPQSHLDHFEGHQDCSISSTDLYIPPFSDDRTGQTQASYCSTRATLLEAMSGGGRHGFEAPFSTTGCHYRWYSTLEICMVLERFDAIVFIGDGLLQHIYAAFNMLLRENIAMGGLKQWEMKESERVKCRCDHQITKADCAKYTVMSNLAVRGNDGGGGNRSPYYCDRKPLVTSVFHS